MSDDIVASVTIDGDKLAHAAANRVRQFFFVTGGIALVFGILLVGWPGRTGRVVVALLGFALLLTALARLSVVFNTSLSTGSRALAAVVAVLLAIAGIYALTHLGGTTVALAYVVGLLVGIAWIVDGVTSLVSVTDAGARPWTTAFALVSVLAGIVMLIAPVTGATAIWLLLGIALIVIGATQIMRGITFGRKIANISR